MSVMMLVCLVMMVYTYVCETACMDVVVIVHVVNVVCRYACAYDRTQADVYVVVHADASTFDVGCDIA